jgi:transposase-like protein
MPAEYAQLIWQIDLLGQSRSRVAKRLGISPNNLGVRLYRARRALRSALERFCTTCPTHGFLNCACEPEVTGAEERPTGRRPVRRGRLKQERAAQVA